MNASWPATMWSRLPKLSRRRPAPDVLLNEGLDLAMNWGEDWLAPIQRRLGERHPQLGASELEALDDTCRRALTFALETAHAMLHAGTVPSTTEAFESAVRARFPWVSQANLARMLNQGPYYAAKMGGHGPAA